MIPRGIYYDCEPGCPPEGADLVSLKYDGVWARAIAHEGTSFAWLRSRTGKHLGYLPFAVPVACDFEIAGELMVQTQWARKYRENNKAEFVAFPEYRELAERHGMYFIREHRASNNWKWLWNDMVIGDNPEIPQFEGLVFRNSKQPGVYWRMKRSETETWTLIDVVRTARGWSLVGERDGVRQSFPHGREQDVEHIGREFAAQGAQRTEAGKLRHGQFVRWL
jgi:hypothetical protein